MRHSFATLADMLLCERLPWAGRKLSVLLLLAIALVGWMKPAHAHDLPYSVVEVRIGRLQIVDVEIRCHTAALLSGQPQGVLDPSVRAWFLGLPDADIANRSRLMASYLERSAIVGRPHDWVQELEARMPSAKELRDDARQDQDTLAPSAPVRMSGQMRSRPKELTVRFPPELGVVLLKVSFGDQLDTSRMIFPGDTSTFSLAGREGPSSSVGSDWSGLFSYFVSGATHILVGLDHLAFLLGLMLLSRSAMQLVKTLTAFTIAHSVTLCLTAVDVITFPSRLVEIAIAATIVLLGLSVWKASGETGSPPRGHSWPTALAFGLVHGMGLAGGLVIADPDGESVLERLAVFNLGVEAGQLIFVVAVYFGVRALDRVTPVRRVIHSPVPGGCLVVLGLFWVSLRTVGGVSS